MYPSYLIHFNRNHSSKNGQFTSGDGDGDGTRNDHGHRDSRKSDAKYKSTSNNKQFMSRINAGQAKKGVGSSNSKERYSDVDYAKESNKQSKNNQKLGIMDYRTWAGGVKKGESFIDNLEAQEFDEQKLENNEDAKESVRRFQTYAINDIYEEDDEKKKKKNRKVTQSHWGDNYVTGDV